jgi:hypothetical protein
MFMRSDLVDSASLTTFNNIYGSEVPYYVSVDMMVREIQNFAGLEENWDGEGALPVIEQVRENASEAIRRLYKIWGKPDVTPSPNGTVIFEWFHEKVEFYLEIGKDNYCFLAGDEKGFRSDLALSGKLTESSYSDVLANGMQLWEGYPQANVSVFTASTRGSDMFTDGIKLRKERLNENVSTPTLTFPPKWNAQNGSVSDYV